MSFRWRLMSLFIWDVLARDRRVLEQAEADAAKAIVHGIATAVASIPTPDQKTIQGHL